MSAETGYSPAPPILAFAPGGPGPQPPAVAVSPTQDLEPGDEIVVRGAGFDPGSSSTRSRVRGTGRPTRPASSWCSGDGGDEQIDDDGGFAVLFEVPDPGDMGEVVDGDDACDHGSCADGVCPPPTAVATDCSGGSSSAPSGSRPTRTGTTVGPPTFAPEPVVVTFGS